MASSYDEIYKTMSEKATDYSDTYRTKATAKSSSSDSTMSSDGVKKNQIQKHIQQQISRQKVWMKVML